MDLLLSAFKRNISSMGLLILTTDLQVLSIVAAVVLFSGMLFCVSIFVVAVSRILFVSHNRSSSYLTFIVQ